MIYTNEKNELYTLCQVTIQALEQTWRLVQKAGMENEQFVLDWLDKVNEISTRN